MATLPAWGAEWLPWGHHNYASLHNKQDQGSEQHTENPCALHGNPAWGTGCHVDAISDELDQGTAYRKPTLHETYTGHAA